MWCTKVKLCSRSFVAGSDSPGVAHVEQSNFNLAKDAKKFLLTEIQNYLSEMADKNHWGLADGWTAFEALKKSTGDECSLEICGIRFWTMKKVVPAVRGR